MPHREPRLLAFPIRCVHVVALAALLGCRQADQVETYRIAKPEGDTRPAASAPPTAPAAPAGDPTDRMIGSILPGEGQAWFFKVVGPLERVDASADTIKTFLASVKLEGQRPTWETPGGWTERPQQGMRLATLELPGEGAPLEMSVIGLPRTGDWDAQVLDNVNRWRKQLKLEPLAAGELADATESLDGDAVLIDATGWFDGGSMPPFAGRAPFAGGAATTPPRAAPPTPRAPAGGLQYETPEGWADAPGSAMRKASLRTAGGAEVTAFVFPAAGAMGDPLENVNRWRREVGLAPTDAAALAEESETIDLLGGEGTYVELVGAQETTHAAMVQRDGGVWFFKIRGPGEAVAAERDTFREWLGTLSL